MPQATFPMYVLPASRVLTLECLPKHEEIRDELVEWTEEKTTLFVSQTWLRFAHPDNESNGKLGYLQHFLREAMGGRMTIHAAMDVEAMGLAKKIRLVPAQTQTIAWVWFDIFSVPQADPVNQGKAISSLPAYVAYAAYFLVLAGAWKHENGTVRDYRAWYKRGWCRLEQLSNALGPSPKQLILMQSRSDIVAYGAMGITGYSWTLSGVGVGNFTVESDRAALGPVVLSLIEERMAAKRAEGTEEGWRWYRALHSLKPTLLAGLPVHDPPIANVDEWLKHLGYSAATETDSHGWAPLRYAAVEGRVDLASALLARGADVEAPLRADDLALNGFRGMTIFVCIMFYDRGPMIRLLLSHGANPFRKMGGMHVLVSGYSYASIANLEALHELAPHSVEILGIPFLGSRILTNPFYGSNTEAMRWIMDRFPESVMDTKTGFPNGLLATIMMDKGELDALSTALDSGKFDLEYFDARAGPLAFKVLRWIGGLNFRFRKNPSKMLEFGALIAGTALHVAAFKGNLPAVDLLLKHGANVASQGHERKMTPLHVAAAMGHEDVCARLLNAGAPTAAQDNLRRTPAWWAKRRGHAELATLLMPEAPPSSRIADGMADGWKWGDKVLPNVQVMHSETPL